MSANRLPNLGMSVPVIAAPMGGGPSTPALVVAAARAGGLGFLPGGYKTAGQLSEQIAQVRAGAASFGVNLFAPNPIPVDPGRYHEVGERLRADAERLGVSLPTDPVEDDDHWQDKIELLLADPVPVVSFTFGIPPRAALDALRIAGSVLVQTVTSVDEARAAVEAGVDVLAVQGAAAGGHFATLSPDHAAPDQTLPDLLDAISRAVALPLIAAGGLADPESVAATVAGHADAVMVGTVLLRSSESGVSAAHRTALADPGRATVVTRAFTGRPARGLRNTFIDRYDADAPLGYPAIHHLTSPLRRASAAQGDPEFVNLWAGTGFRHATEEPAEVILRRLASKL
ncbi:MAG: nitronate monooxygenase [Jatrophihabitantaceae bacterium]